jgi:Na+-translocating ferredoxin:NAD+ oxidoreductase RnfG subunit
MLRVVSGTASAGKSGDISLIVGDTGDGNSVLSTSGLASKASKAGGKITLASVAVSDTIELLTVDGGSELDYWKYNSCTLQ